MAIDMTFEAREKIFRREEHEDGVKEGIAQGISNSVSMLKELNHSKEEAIAALNKSYPDYSDFITEIVNIVYK